MYVRGRCMSVGDKLGQMGWWGGKLPIPLKQIHVCLLLSAYRTETHSHTLYCPRYKHRTTHKRISTQTFDLYTVCWVSAGGVMVPVVSNKSKSDLLWALHLTSWKPSAQFHSYDHTGTKGPSCQCFLLFLLSNIYVFVLSRYIGPRQSPACFPPCARTASAASTWPQTPPTLQAQWIVTPQPLP